MQSNELGITSLTDFAEGASDPDYENNEDGPIFQVEHDRILRIRLDGRVWHRHGSMIAYKGDVKFVREGIAEHGMKMLVKRRVTGEIVALNKAIGVGTVYVASGAKHITILRLEEEETFYVNGGNVLAFEDSVHWDITPMKKAAGILQGGFFVIKFKGPGLVAITTLGSPKVLRVYETDPVFTDPQATVAWSGTLQPDLKFDISFKTFLGRGSGESVQMHFHSNDGWVVIQPTEAFYATRGAAGSG
eukprot:TRINITY_DN3696_c0_g1_i1.p1 TRINITY_DN3696_c0_g1~~TRINITY_DN3696_c0_g1_i1.p1  ORF type:complete len:246 (+),score=36.53 TRINITY_DN3696_c0_g1_i1:121-858(+)